SPTSSRCRRAWPKRSSWRATFRGRDEFGSRPALIHPRPARGQRRCGYILQSGQPVTRMVPYYLSTNPPPAAGVNKAPRRRATGPSSPSERMVTSPVTSRLPSFSSRASALRSRRAGFRRKLMLRLMVTASGTGPTAPSTATYMAKSASAIMVGPEIVPPGRMEFSWNIWRTRQPPSHTASIASPLSGWKTCGNSAARKRPSSSTVIAIRRPPCDDSVARLERTANARVLPRRLPPELHAQLVLGPHQCSLARGGQILTGTIDVEGEHRKRGAERIGLAPPAVLGRALQRRRDALGVARREDPAVQGQRVAVLGDVSRPAPAAAPALPPSAVAALGRGLSPGGHDSPVSES